MMTHDDGVGRALPAISEDTRELLALALSAPFDDGVRRATPTSVGAGAASVRGTTPPATPPLAPSLSPSSSRASSVSSSSSSLRSSNLARQKRRHGRREGVVAAASTSSATSPQPIYLAYTNSSSNTDVRPLRQRFLSSDVVVKQAASGSNNLTGGRFLSPLTKLHASSFASSLSLRRWVTAKASAVRGGITRSLSLNRYPSSAGDGVPTAGPWDDAVYELERPRTRSENFLNHTKRGRMHMYSVDLLPVEGGADDAEEEEDRASELSNDDGDDCSVSSMDDAENAGDAANVAASAAPDDLLSPEEESEKLEKLHNLQRLLQEGFITVTEYKDRHVQLVGEASAVTEPTIAKATDLLALQLPIIYHDPPDFSQIRARDAIKHVFDSVNCKWTSSRIQVKIDSQPFARGGLRQVFHLQDLSAASSSATGQRYDSYVAKVAINPNENPDTYFRDVEMQAVAAKFAKLYNSYNPPRRVEFVEAWILQLIPSTANNAGSSIDGGDGDDDNLPEGLSLHGMICGVEPFIAGEYHKHNNNFGYVSELERNTPQAFSHFTYEASGEQILVVDIQGVGDHYTDPQIHTRRGKEFGKGNLAVRGFERFLGSHRCNPICRYLKLPLINPKDDDPQRGNADPKGTVPAQTYMSQPRVDKVDSVLCHYYAESKAFQRYRAASRQDLDDEADGRPKPLSYYLRGGVWGGPGVKTEKGKSASTNSDRMLVPRDMRYDQRSCSLFFCGAGQQCVIS